MSERKKIYSVNLNVFISQNMIEALEAGTKASGYPSLSAYVRKLLALGMKKKIMFEE